MTWDYEGFDASAYLDAWLSDHFGADAVDAVRDLYMAFFAAYPVLDDTRHPQQRVLMDGVVRIQGLKLLDYLQSGEFDLTPNRQLGKWGSDYDDTGVNSMESYFSTLAAMLSNGIAGWDRVQDCIYEVLSQVKPEARQFFVDHFLVQLEQISGLYRWCLGLCRAAEAHHTGDDPAPYMDAAASALQKALLDRKKAEHDHWAHWYRGDKKMNLPDVLNRTHVTLALLQGEPA